MRSPMLGTAAVGLALVACGVGHASSPGAVAVPPPSAETSPGGASSAAASATPPPATRTAVKAGSDQPGVLLSIDDKFVGTLPQDVDVSAGTHSLHFAGKNYEPLDKSVDVPAGQTVDVGAVKLQVTRGTVTFPKAPPGAKVFLERGKDKREIPMLPVAVEMDAAPAWTVHATKAGFCDFVQQVDFSDGSPDRTIEIDLHRPPCH